MVATHAAKGCLQCLVFRYVPLAICDVLLQAREVVIKLCWILGLMSQTWSAQVSLSHQMRTWQVRKIATKLMWRWQQHQVMYREFNHIHVPDRRFVLYVYLLAIGSAGAVKLAVAYKAGSEL